MQHASFSTIMICLHLLRGFWPRCVGYKTLCKWQYDLATKSCEPASPAPWLISHVSYLSQCYQLYQLLHCCSR